MMNRERRPCSVFSFIIPHSSFIIHHSIPMLLPAPPLYPRRRKPRGKDKSESTPTPPAALTLVGASYDGGGQMLTLAFDRAVDVAGVVVGAFVVNDASSHG